MDDTVLRITGWSWDLGVIAPVTVIPQADLGMYYYKARIYSPTLGRFMQTDPIGYEDQVNLYAYVGNDPVNMTDPTGTDSAFEYATLRDERALLDRKISEKEFKDRQQARGAGGVAGAAIVVGVVAGKEIIAAVGGFKKAIEITMHAVRLTTAKPALEPVLPTPTVQNPPVPRQPTNPPRPESNTPKNPTTPKPRGDGRPNEKPVKEPPPPPKLQRDRYIP